MNKRKFNILSLLQWIFYPVSGLMLLAFLADAFGGYRYWTDAVWGLFDRAEDPVAMIFVPGAVDFSISGLGPPPLLFLFSSVAPRISC